MSARDHVAEYLLGELTAAERTAFEVVLRDDPELRAEVERLQPVVELLRPDVIRPPGYSSSPSSSSST